MTSFSNVNTAFSALQAAQAGMMVTSQNVAGASIDGYSRRRSELSVGQQSQNATATVSSTGFTMEGFVRDYSQLVDGQRLNQLGEVNKSQGLVDATTSLDTLLIDQTVALGPVLDSFYSTGSALVRNPQDQASRSVFMGAAATLVNRMHGMSDSLEAITTYAQDDLRTTLDLTNRSAADLAAVNKGIIASTGATPPDLLDRRDLLLQTLHASVGGQSSINADGSAVFRISGSTLVDRVVANAIAADEDGKLTLSLGVGDQAYKQSIDASAVSAGKAGADLHLILDFVPALRKRLDTVATDLASGMSALKDGAASMFDFAGTPSAKNLKLAFTNPDELQVDIAGAAGLSTLQASSSKQWAEFVSFAAAKMSTWNNDLSANKAVQNQLQSEKERVSGVNLDEEAANLLTFQQLYQAASKVMEASSKMFDTLLSAVR